MVLPKLTRQKKVIFSTFLGVGIAIVLIGIAAIAGFRFLADKLTDPAVDLAHAVAAKSRELKRSPLQVLTFEHIPDAAKARKSPRFNTAVIIELIVRSEESVASGAGKSVIMVNNWSGTSYHNRYVKVENSMTAQHPFGDPFVITLEKRGAEILWTGIK